MFKPNLSGSIIYMLSVAIILATTNGQFAFENVKKICKNSKCTNIPNPEVLHQICSKHGTTNSTTDTNLENICLCLGAMPTLSTNSTVVLLQNCSNNALSNFNYTWMAEEKSNATDPPTFNQIGKKKRQNTLLLLAITSAISGIFVFLAILVHLFIFKLNHHSKVLVSHATCLLIMYVCITIRILANYNRATAKYIIFSLQYISTLGAFLWLGVLAFDLWRVFVNLNGNRMIATNNKQEQDRAFMYKCAYALGIPILMCTIVIIISSSPEAQRKLHIVVPVSHITGWFSNNLSVFVFFYGPIMMILLKNVVFFILTILNIRKARHGTSILNSKVNRKLFKVYVKLFFIMGLSWMTEIIAWILSMCKIKTDEAYWYVTNTINLSQGLFIFLIYVCKKKTIRLLNKKLCSWKHSDHLHENFKKINSISTVDMTNKKSIVLISYSNEYSDR